MNFKFSTNFLLPYARKPAKYGGCGSTGLDATPTVQIHTGHPVGKLLKQFSTFGNWQCGGISYYIVKVLRIYCNNTVILRYDCFTNS